MRCCICDNRLRVHVVCGFFLFCLSAGFKFRRRNITNNPTGGEGSCPHLVEAVPCEDPSCFTWQLVKLEECVPEDDMDCGEGTQNPQVRCVNSEGNKCSSQNTFMGRFPDR